MADMRANLALKIMEKIAQSGYEPALKVFEQFAQYWHPLLVQTLQTLIHMFEVTLDMVVSKGEQGRTVTMALTTLLQDELTKRITPLGARMVKEKHLGVTTAAGRRRRVGASSKRAAKFAARKNLRKPRA